MSVEQIVTTYFDQIELKDTDYLPWDDAKSDMAYILLRVPTAMLKDYVKFKGQNRELPDGEEFWRETRLVERLRNSGKYHGQGHEPLEDMLDFLGNNVQVEYCHIGDPEKIDISITEFPAEFYED